MGASQQCPKEGTLPPVLYPSCVTPGSWFGGLQAPMAGVAVEADAWRESPWEFDKSCLFVHFPGVLPTVDPASKRQPDSGNVENPGPKWRVKSEPIVEANGKGCRMGFRKPP